MKKCKVYCNDKNAEADGVIIDGRVLLPAPLLENIEPAYTTDGQYYYPPYYAAEFAKDMNFGLMPFSTECEWGEYAEINSHVRSIAQVWFGDDYNEKWGYCNVKTGEIRIPPEMRHCGDFNAFGAAIVNICFYAIIDTLGDIKDGLYTDIQQSHQGLFFVYESCAGWGVCDDDGCELIEPRWDDIEWDGTGGVTVINRKSNGSEVYGIRNIYYGYADNVVDGLTEKPVIYDVIYGERFRLIIKDNKYGLIHDEDDGSILVCEPIYEYEALSDELRDYVAYNDINPFENIDEV